MMSALIPYWLVKKEIQVVMDKTGNPGQKVSVFCPWYGYKDNMDYLDFPPNFGSAQCRNVEITDKHKGKEKSLIILSFGPYLNQWVLSICPAKMGIPLLSLLFVLPHSSSAYCSHLLSFLSNNIFSLISFLSESSISSRDLFSSRTKNFSTICHPRAPPLGGRWGPEQRTKAPSCTLVF